ncbi:hypothetical protein DTW90_34615 [Neorhizobium sp. P12A]|uniref:hypothetical protein n=1 Tax=Neorhizobium sp. P12A TaxID=2268027 RepID=UPI0011EFDFC7|nr:hypothetical protein [Neorhizobium sp. P12A]KAA0686021.1 hypothetical protein DTW90_34615 [Neorhizobium sp. P12A]
MSAPVVRAKFRVMNIDAAQNADPNNVFVTIRMIPVWEHDGVNKAWSKATPSGELKISITNPAAIDKFDLGKEYFLDFTPAE